MVVETLKLNKRNCRKSYSIYNECMNDIYLMITKVPIILISFKFIIIIKIMINIITITVVQQIHVFVIYITLAWVES